MREATSVWPNRRLIELLGIEHPIIQAPMAGAQGAALASAVTRAGGLGSLPCALLTADEAQREMETIRQSTRGPVNVNFFCHTPPALDPQREANWRRLLAPYHRELGLDPDHRVGGAMQKPFDSAWCDRVVKWRPAVVSFHFGLPPARAVERLKRAGIRILGSATTVEEARWLEAHGADVIVAQGVEAGGHRGMFLTDDVATQPGLFALLPQVVAAVQVPVVAAGAIADGHSIAATIALGAAGVQIGTAYLFCPEAKISEVYRAALRRARAHDTVVTNVLTGRPARGIVNRAIRELGPLCRDVPQFPLATATFHALRSAAEAAGSGDFSRLWAGQAVGLGREIDAGALTQLLARETMDQLSAGMMPLLRRVCDLGSDARES